MLALTSDAASPSAIRVEGVSQQTQGLKSSNNDGAVEKQGREGAMMVQSGEEVKGPSWCYKLLYIVILLSLAAFIVAEIIIDHQLKIKQSNRFHQNLEVLRREELAKTKGKSAGHKEQQQISIYFSSNDEMQRMQAAQAKSSGLDIKELKRIPQKKMADSGLGRQADSLSEIPTKMTQLPQIAGVKAQPTAINPKESSPQPSQPPSNAHHKRNPTNEKPAQSPSKTVFGSGINIGVLERAKERKGLINIGLDEENEVSLQQIKYFEQKYGTGKYDELPICVVIPTFNNAANDRYLNNIKSVVMQNYSNYHLVVIDDASTDSTGQLILEFLRSQTKVGEYRYEVVRNAQQMRAMSNLRFAAKTYCKPKDIFIIVDGDDELIGRQVFKFYNAKFQSDGLWFMYSNFLTMAGRIGYSRPFPSHIIANNKYRIYPFITSHLRAFYTQLFLNIREEDLKDEQGEYLRAANDVAICIPILEQAHTHVQYVPEITYFYNSNTGLNNHALRLREQRTNDKKIRLRPKYEELKVLIPNQ